MVVAGDDAIEALGEGEVAVLGDGHVEANGEVGFHEDERGAAGGEGLIEGVGEHAGLEASAAEECVLGEGDALEGQELLGIDGGVDADEIGLEVVDLFDVLEADDGEAGGGEAVFARVLGRAGLAFGSAGPGGELGIGDVGRALPFGDWIEVIGHEGSSTFRHSTGVGWSLKLGCAGGAKIWACGAGEACEREVVPGNECYRRE